MKFDALQVLNSIQSEELARVAEQLNRTGFATDQDPLCLSSTLIEQWSNACTSLISGYGYEGGTLGRSSKYFAALGAIYVLFDESRHSPADACIELDRVAKQDAAHEFTSR